VKWDNRHSWGRHPVGRFGRPRDARTAGQRCPANRPAGSLTHFLRHEFDQVAFGFPLPVLAAGAALWREESHVDANRAYYNASLATDPIRSR